MLFRSSIFLLDIAFILDNRWLLMLNYCPHTQNQAHPSKKWNVYLQGVSQTYAYLPQGGTWYSIRDGEYGKRLKSGFQFLDAPINEMIPVFARGSSPSIVLLKEISLKMDNKLVEIYWDIIAYRVG